MSPSTPAEYPLDLDSSEVTYPSSGMAAQAVSTPEELKRSKYELDRRGWRRIVANFTPSWFTVTMGTGITSILLHNLPYNGRWLFYISVIAFCLNIALFVLFSCISIVRYTVFRGSWSSTLRHPAQAVFLGMHFFPSTVHLTDRCVKEQFRLASPQL
jgi:hypothetical protein